MLVGPILPRHLDRGGRDDDAGGDDGFVLGIVFLRVICHPAVGSMRLRRSRWTRVLVILRCVFLLWILGTDDRGMCLRRSRLDHATAVGRCLHLFVNTRVALAASSCASVRQHVLISARNCSGSYLSAPWFVLLGRSLPGPSCCRT